MVSQKLLLASVLAAVASTGVQAFQPVEGMTRQVEVGSAFNTKFLMGKNAGFLDEARRSGSLKDIATAAVEKHVGDIKLALSSEVLTQHNKITSFHFKQMVNGIECTNCQVNVNVNSEGQVISIGSSAVDMSSQKRVATQARTAPLDAINAFALHAGLTQGRITPARQMRKIVDGQSVHSFTFEKDEFSRSTGLESQTIDAKLVYVRDGNNELVLSWQFGMNSEAPRYAMYQACMSADAADKSLPVLVEDLVKWERDPNEKKKSAAADSAYLAYGVPDMDPRLGERVEDNVSAEPEWVGTQLDSRGNNVDARYRGGQVRSSGGPTKNFTHPIDFTREPSEYREAAIDNLFYWNNLVHKLFYAAGFDEASGNFQTDNFGRGGRGNDAVIAEAQEPSGFNNANFATPADGGAGRMNMYLWNQQSPMLDGDLDSGIVIHEYGHGISTRLTGGPMDSGCLRGEEAGGMGEGWGDTWATMLSIRAEDAATGAQPRPMGEYAAGRGIRPFPYSTDMDTNPQMYSDVGGLYTAVHSMGSVWANVLMEVFWELVDKNGFDEDWENGRGGNNILFNNIVDGLKLQPCTPSMVQARDAIMQADRANPLYNGINQCDMWRAFAKRGFGEDAVASQWLLGLFPTAPAVNGMRVPAECN